MIEGQFDTDSQTLKKRIQSHEKYGAADLNAWIFDRLAPAEGQTILDLGCGTGKQSIPMAERVGPAGNIFSVDVSRESLEALEKSAREKNLDGRIRTFSGGMDNLEKEFESQSMDRVLGSYSLYYARDPVKLIETIRRLLKPHGRLFFCGPSRRNNAELKSFHFGLMRRPVPAEGGAADFMEGVGPETCRRLFAAVNVSSFGNPLRFDSPDALYAYWSSYNLYDKSIDEEFRKAAENYFKTAAIFETVKRVVGVTALVPPV